ncbi:hypothetical protein GCM10010191_11720 [Actinomadura vinacea]|uniref:RDD domain-containing protein n=1 Tax=Actinomadura vinacea TaxID=115336 RepID=A0ABN3IKJ0_9ACTN
MAADQAPNADPLPEEGPPSGTSEPASSEAPSGLAEPGQRLLARIVDTLVVGLPVVVVVREVVPAADADIVAPPAVAGFLLLYEWVQLALWGRTLGKRFAGIEVVRQTASAGLSAAPEGALGRPGAPSQSLEAVAEPQQEGKSEPAASPDEHAPEGAPTASLTDGTLQQEPVQKPLPLGVTRSLLRSAAYALPIAARPVPVFGLIAGLFWVGNAALMYEGLRRQALHDRLAATIVVKRGSA